MDETLVWEREFGSKRKIPGKIPSDACRHLKEKPNQVFSFKQFKVFEYDSIRIYISEGDTALIELVEKGYIHGPSFFSDHESNQCNKNQWTNPKQNIENGWLGYHFFLGNLREIKFGKIPRKVGSKAILTKTFRFNFRYSGQPFPNPSIFQLEIKNPNFKLNQHQIDLEQLLHEGEIVNFFRKGMEI